MRGPSLWQTPEEATRLEYAAYDRLPPELRRLLRMAVMEHSARKVLAMLERTGSEAETTARFLAWLKINDREPDR